MQRTYSSQVDPRLADKLDFAPPTYIALILNILQAELLADLPLERRRFRRRTGDDVPLPHELVRSPPLHVLERVAEGGDLLKG